MWFIKRCFDALNAFDRVLEGWIPDLDSSPRVDFRDLREQVEGRRMEQRYNEKTAQVYLDSVGASLNLGVNELNGASLREYWLNSVNNLAVKTDSAKLEVESSGLIMESLKAQVSAISGVSLDEEAINMLTYQRQFQAGARFIQVIDEMLQVLLSIA